MFVVSSMFKTEIHCIIIRNLSPQMYVPFHDDNFQDPSFKPLGNIYNTFLLAITTLLCRERQDSFGKI